MKILRRIQLSLCTRLLLLQSGSGGDGGVVRWWLFEIPTAANRGDHLLAEACNMPSRTGFSSPVNTMAVLFCDPID